LKKQLDINTWNRREHFHFFRQFEEPFWGVTVHVDVTSAYKTAKELGCSFFLYYLYQSLKAANEVEAFRYRIENETEVVVYEYLNPSTTVNRPDGTFGFSYISYFTDFQLFIKNAKIEIERVRQNSGLEFREQGDNLIHYSTIPSLDFTSLSHARMFSYKNSIPKITFGKMTNQNEKLIMPISIHVHHALVDGAQVGEFVELFQKKLNE
jgi:chloramphenicol O-acetyltransferase type A